MRLIQSILAGPDMSQFSPLHNKFLISYLNFMNGRFKNFFLSTPPVLFSTYSWQLLIVNNSLLIRDVDKFTVYHTIHYSCILSLGLMKGGVRYLLVMRLGTQASYSQYYDENIPIFSKVVR
ncbi:hypothetical protein F5B19DRAFT_476067 [Rostrohypoxylon terebratum]|nr:hypothetical protein F5B19DRAFT_476067 [Rostrohypoxylon terebratum]